MVHQHVYIVGATGATGASIVDGLIEKGDVIVIAGVRPSSASKPEVEALKSRGVEIRILDLDNSDVDQIAETLKGIDTVISAIYFKEIPKQKILVDASKKAGVRRFIPCDWGTACIRGVRELFDQKLEIQDHVKETGLGYTFIDVGWWMQVTLPFAEHAGIPVPSIMKARIGAGNVKCAVTDRRDIGKFVARIIADDRTINRYVFCWTQEVTQNEAFAIAERVIGRSFDAETITSEEVAKLVKDAQSNAMDRTVSEYVYSIWVRGDNTVENAKKEEYGNALDARALYPDIGKHLRTLEDFAKELSSAQ